MIAPRQDHGHKCIGLSPPKGIKHVDRILAGSAVSSIALLTLLSSLSGVASAAIPNPPGSGNVNGWTGVGCWAEGGGCSTQYGTNQHAQQSGDTGGCVSGCGSGANQGNNENGQGCSGCITLTGSQQTTGVTQIASFSSQYQDGYGNDVYLQGYSYLSNNSNYIYTALVATETAGSNYVLNGNYPAWSIYDCVGCSPTDSMQTWLYYPDGNQQTSGTGQITQFTPPNTASDGSSASWGYGLSATASAFSTGSVTGDVTWSTSLPEFSEQPTSLTSYEGSWLNTDNDGQNLNAPTAATWSAGVTVPVVHGAMNYLSIGAEGYFITSNGVWLTINWILVYGYAYDLYLS